MDAIPMPYDVQSTSLQGVDCSVPYFVMLPPIHYYVMPSPQYLQIPSFLAPEAQAIWSTTVPILPPSQPCQKPPAPTVESTATNTEEDPTSSFAPGGLPPTPMAHPIPTPPLALQPPPPTIQAPSPIAPTTGPPPVSVSPAAPTPLATKALQCYHCGGEGHKACRCPHNPKTKSAPTAACCVHGKLRTMLNLRPHATEEGKYECVSHNPCLSKVVDLRSEN
jgi:hypothetical protein